MYADEANLPEDYEIREEQRSKSTINADGYNEKVKVYLRQLDLAVNLGKWVLRYLFEGFVTAELVGQEEELQNFKALQTDESPNHTGRSSPSFSQQALEPQTPNIKVTSLPAPAPIPTHSNGLTNVTNQATENLDLSQNTATHSGAATAPTTAFQRQDYFSGAHHDNPPQTPLIQAPPPAAFTSNNGPMSPTTGGFMGRLRNLSVKAKLGRTPSAEAKMEGGMMSSLASSADNSSSLQPSVSEIQPNDPKS